MSCTHYYNTELYIENVSLKAIAQEFGTPTYIYSQERIKKNWGTFSAEFNSIPHRICYAVKANSNIAILHLLAQLNAGFDIVSSGELERALIAGADPKKIIFSGVGKQLKEIEQGIIKDIYCFNIESAAELDRLHLLSSKLKTKINIAFRINPNINPDTHAYISTGLQENKFGIERSEIISLCQKLKNYPYLQLIGIACHIGSQITQLKPFELAIDCLLEIYQQLKQMDITIQHVNIGGGLGITYRDEKPPSIHDYATILQKKLAHYPLEMIIEPGRAIVGDAGILLTKVEYLKHHSHKNFAIVDAGMNDLLRPALYHAWQNILPVSIRQGEKKRYDIAGPVCESADFLGKDRELVLLPDDLLSVENAGAYGFCMSSNYNSRYRPAEILVNGNEARLIRRRESINDLIALEQPG